MDIGSKHDIHVILKELAESGMGIIVISDDIPELLSVTNRVLLLQEGRIVGEVDPAATTQRELSDLITGASTGVEEK